MKGVWLALVVVALGCSVEPGHPGARCASDDACTSGVCYRGFCIEGDREDAGMDGGVAMDSGSSDAGWLPPDIGPRPDVPGCPAERACSGVSGNCCPEGLECCGAGMCENTSGTDPDNCGGCGFMCRGDEYCDMAKSKCCDSLTRLICRGPGD